jgi:hypothetical protein
MTASICAISESSRQFDTLLPRPQLLAPIEILKLFPVAATTYLRE